MPIVFGSSPGFFREREREEEEAPPQAAAPLFFGIGTFLAGQVALHYHKISVSKHPNPSPRPGVRSDTVTDMASHIGQQVLPIFRRGDRVPMPPFPFHQETRAKVLRSLS